MPRPPKLIARDARILAAYSAGATIPQIAAAEQLDPAIIRTTPRGAFHPWFQKGYDPPHREGPPFGSSAGDAARQPVLP